MKSWHVTVLEDHKKVVFEKMVLSAKEATELLKECVEKYPPPKFKCLREWY